MAGGTSREGPAAEGETGFWSMGGAGGGGSGVEGKAKGFPTLVSHWGD